MNPETMKTVAILAVIAFIVLMLLRAKEGFYRGYWPYYWNTNYWVNPYRYYYPYRYRRRRYRYWPLW